MIVPRVWSQANEACLDALRQIVCLLCVLVNIAAVQCGNVRPIGAVLTVADVV